LPKACQRLRDISDTDLNVPALPLNGAYMGLDFSSADFQPITSEEPLSKCRAMAEEAMMLAFFWGNPKCGRGI